MNTFYTALQQQGVLLIEGPDSDTFLQGQTTCDLNQLNRELSITGAYCNPQGRMVTEFRLLACGEDARLLRMHRGLCENSAAVFGKYIVFSKAEIFDASENWRLFALWGDGATGLLAAGSGKKDRVVEAHGAFWVQVDDAGLRFEAFIPTGDAAELEAWLAQSSQPGFEAQWRLADINAGLGHLQPETLEMFIPQMLNYQLTGQVSFSKGCYTGQEVVARMHYRGKLKRPMYLASVESQEAPFAGEPLFRPGSEQSVGNVVNAAADDSAYRLLAVVATDAIDHGIHLGSTNGPRLEFHELPYSLIEDEART